MCWMSDLRYVVYEKFYFEYFSKIRQGHAVNGATLTACISMSFAPIQVFQSEYQRYCYGLSDE